MTPGYLNLSLFPSITDHDDHLHNPSIYQAASSCSYITTRNFFDSASIQDQTEIYHQNLQQPQFQQDLADNFASSHCGSFDIENDESNDGLNYENHESSNYQIKMRLMLKMKKDVVSPSTTKTLIKLEGDEKLQQPSSPMETDSSNSSNSNPIRICSDCNTTKTPLWRSGPRGPKSLCNACGIRQRKARRAMEAAAAAANDTVFEKETTPPLVIKTKNYNKSKTKTKQQKDKTPGCGVNVAKFKKRGCNLIDDHKAQKKVCLEDFLLTLTKNLAHHHQVFPQDEKDAAILLMALSFDHAHHH